MFFLGRECGSHFGTVRWSPVSPSWRYSTGSLHVGLPTCASRALAWQVSSTLIDQTSLLSGQDWFGCSWNLAGRRPAVQRPCTPYSIFAAHDCRKTPCNCLSYNDILYLGRKAFQPRILNVHNAGRPLVGCNPAKILHLSNLSFPWCRDLHRPLRNLDHHSAACANPSCLECAGHAGLGLCFSHVYRLPSTVYRSLKRELKTQRGFALGSRSKPYFGSLPSNQLTTSVRHSPA